MTDQPSKTNVELIQQLAASKEVFRVLVDSVSDYAIFMLDLNGNVLTWNEGAQRIKGYQENEILGKHFSVFYTQEARDNKQPRRELEIALEVGRFEEEGWRVRKDGSLVWVDVVVTPAYEDGKLIGFANVSRDLTERKLASQSEQIFRLLVHAVTDYALYMLDPDGNVMTWNEGAEHIKGYRADEIIGKHFSIFYTQEAQDSKHPQHELEVARSTGRYEEEGWRIRKDGSRLWVSVVITAVHVNDRLIGFAKVTRDLTERKQGEQREAIFRLLVSGVSEYAIFMLDPNGNVMTWNEGASRIKGYTEEEIIGKHFSIFYTKEAQDRKHPQYELERATATGRYEEEGWRIRKDRSLLWASVVITAIRSNGKLIGFAKVTRDLTQRLLADQEREMSAKMLDETNSELRKALEVKSRFLSTISHEVRTPMAGIIGMAELMTQEDLGEDNNGIINSIFESSKRLLQLLNNLLESAQMDSGDVQLENRAFPIRAGIGDVRQLVAPEAVKKGLTITGSCDPKIPELVYGDELKIRQILLNLAHNAVKFTKSGGVNISAVLTEKTSSTTTVRFSVADTGIGLKPSDRDKLFEPFVQAEDSTKRLYGGSGLGLSIAKKLVEAMGGTLGYDSELGHGATFWFEIPFLDIAKA